MRSLEQCKSDKQELSMDECSHVSGNISGAFVALVLFAYLVTGRIQS